MDEAPRSAPDLPEPLGAPDDPALLMVRLRHAVRRVKDRAASLFGQWLDRLLLIEEELEPADAEAESVYEDGFGPYGTLTLMELDPPAAPIGGYDPAQDEPAGPYDERSGSSDVGDWLDHILFVRRPCWWERAPDLEGAEFVPQPPADEPEPPPDALWALPAGLIVTALALIPLVTFRDRHPAEWLTWDHVPGCSAIFGAALALSTLRDARPERYLVDTARVVASFALGLGAVGLAFFPFALHQPLTGIELALLSVVACLGSALAMVMTAAVVMDEDRIWQPVDEWLDKPAPGFISRAWFRIACAAFRAVELGTRNPKLATAAQQWLLPFNAPARRVVWTALSGALDRALLIETDEPEVKDLTPAAPAGSCSGDPFPAPKDLSAG
jgi:hypothetical protein